VHFQKCRKSTREAFVVDGDKEAGYVHGEFRIGDGDDLKNRLILSPTKQKCWK